MRERDRDTDKEKGKNKHALVVVPSMFFRRITRLMPLIAAVEVEGVGVGVGVKVEVKVGMVVVVVVVEYTRRHDTTPVAPPAYRFALTLPTRWTN
ncbi:hypothetical protein M0802_004910 [Mischocyttarus mexicanus]|nr:hypothetical protein M0802_004910 [Mischocyttarus mexicanus]